MEQCARPVVAASVVDLAALSKSAGAVSRANKALNDEQATMRGSLNDERARQESFLEGRPLAADPPQATNVIAFENYKFTSSPSKSTDSMRTDRMTKDQHNDQRQVQQRLS